jgi:hypothetical protein
LEPLTFSTAVTLDESTVNGLLTVIPPMSWSEAEPSMVPAPVPSAEPPVAAIVPRESVVPPV